MNSREIFACMFNDTYISKHFFGVYAADDGLNCSRPGLYILNTDVSGNAGRHWLLVFVDEDCNGHIFDSLGFRGEYRSRIARSIHGAVFVATQLPLQAMNTQTCGAYALYFARELSKGRTRNDMVSVFSSINLHANDCFVQNYLWSHFSRFLKILAA